MDSKQQKTSKPQGKYHKEATIVYYNPSRNNTFPTSFSGIYYANPETISPQHLSNLQSSITSMWHHSYKSLFKTIRKVELKSQVQLPHTIEKTYEDCVLENGHAEIITEEDDLDPEKSLFGLKRPQRKKKMRVLRQMYKARVSASTLRHRTLRQMLNDFERDVFERAIHTQRILVERIAPAYPTATQTTQTTTPDKDSNDHSNDDSTNEYYLRKHDGDKRYRQRATLLGGEKRYSSKMQPSRSTGAVNKARFIRERVPDSGDWYRRQGCMEVIYNLVEPSPDAKDRAADALTRKYNEHKEYTEQIYKYECQQIKALDYDREFVLVAGLRRGRLPVVLAQYTDKFMHRKNQNTQSQYLRATTRHHVRSNNRKMYRQHMQDFSVDLEKDIKLV